MPLIQHQVLSDIGVCRAREEVADKRLSSSEVFLVNPSATQGIKSLSKSAWDLSSQIFQPNGKEKQAIKGHTVPKFKVKSESICYSNKERKPMVWP